MKRGIAVLLSLSAVAAVAYLTVSKWAIHHETLMFYDEARGNRPVEVDVAIRRDRELQADAGLIKQSLIEALVQAVVNGASWNSWRVVGLNETAYACGYHNYANFARAFRRRFGHAPGIHVQGRRRQPAARYESRKCALSPRRLPTPWPSCEGALPTPPSRDSSSA